MEFVGEYFEGKVRLKTQTRENNGTIKRKLEDEGGADKIRDGLASTVATPHEQGSGRLVRQAVAGTSARKVRPPLPPGLAGNR